MREIYASFGDLSDDNWRHLVRYGTRPVLDGKLGLAYDSAIAQAFLAVDQDVDLWSIYDRIRCFVLLLPYFKLQHFTAGFAVCQEREKLDRWSRCLRRVDR